MRCSTACDCVHLQGCLLLWDIILYKVNDCILENYASRRTQVKVKVKFSRYRPWGSGRLRLPYFS